MAEPSPPTQARLRTALEERLRMIIRRVDAIEEDLRQPNDADWQEQATERENDEVLEGLDAAGLEEIAQIRASLLRMDEGVYGICARCGEDIAERRLEALPSSTLCIECARTTSA